MSQKPRTGNSRRELLKKAAYLTPLIVTLPVTPSFASAGSRTRPARGGSDNGMGSDGGRGRHKRRGSGRGRK